jgi:hypothetical protein
MPRAWKIHTMHAKSLRLFIIIYIFFFSYTIVIVPFESPKAIMDTARNIHKVSL